MLSDDDDDSYVPESLRNFLEQADRQLDEDLADLLSPVPASSDDKRSVHHYEISAADPNFGMYYDDDDDNDNDYDDEGTGQDTSMFYEILQRETDDEMKRQLDRAQNKQQKQLQQEEEEMMLAKQMEMEMNRHQEEEEEQQQQQQHAEVHSDQDSPEKPMTMTLETTIVPLEQKTPHSATTPFPQQDYSPTTGKRDTDDALQEMMNPSANRGVPHHNGIGGLQATPAGNIDNSKNKKTNGKMSSPSPLKQVERKLQKELDREAKRASIGTPSKPLSSSGLRKRNNQVAPAPTGTVTGQPMMTASPSNTTQRQSQQSKSLPDPAQHSGTGTQPDATSPFKLTPPPVLATATPRSVPTDPTPASSSNNHHQLVYTSSTTTVPKISDQQVKKDTSTAPAVQPNKTQQASIPVAAIPSTEIPVVAGVEVVRSTDVVSVIRPDKVIQHGADQPEGTPKQRTDGTEQEQVFTLQGPVSAHHATPLSGPEITKNALQNINDSVFVAPGSFPARRSVLGPADERKRRLEEYKAAKQKSPPPRKATTSSPPFRARPAHTPPKPKEISFNTTTSQDGIPSNRSVSPLHGGVNPSVAVAGTDKPNTLSPMVSSPLNPRLLEPTISSRRQASNASEAPKANSVPYGALFTGRGRRPLTRPDRNIDRLVKPTRASIANIKQPRGDKQSGMTLSRRVVTPAEMQTAKISNISRLLQATGANAGNKAEIKPNTTNKNIMSEQERKEATAKLRARIQALQKNSKGRAKGRTKESVKNTVDRSEQPKQRLRKMEQERLAKLRAKIVAKDERMQKQAEQHRQMRDSPKLEPPQQIDAENQPDTKKRSQPTIPNAPKFATSRRRRTKDPEGQKNIHDEIVPLASSTDMLMKGLRAPPPRPPGAAATKKRGLTIPQAPNFATTQRHGEKTPTTSPQKVHFSDDSSWYSTLRDGTVSPTSKIASSVKTGPLTVPQTPNFQPIRQRPLPKSTAEMELEEMEYYKNHPFRARPVKLDPLPPKSVLNKKLTAPPRRLTIPEPFNLRTDLRSERHRHLNDDDCENEPSGRFKAMPMPDFGRRHSTTNTGHSSMMQKTLTTTEPLINFRAMSTGTTRTSILPQGEKANPSCVRSKVPSGASGIRFQHKSTKWTPSTRSMGTTAAFDSKKKSPPQTEAKPFRAKPMPNFIPKTIQISKKTPDAHGDMGTGDEAERSDIRSNSSPEKSENFFRARPMPNFDHVEIPVQHRDPSKIRSPPSQRKSEETSPSTFHARPVPKSLTKEPTIPVKKRNPNKLRSPDSVRRPDQSPTMDAFPTFQAQPIPHSVLAEPKIPVRSRDPTRLRSPESADRSGIQLPSEVVVESTSFHTRPVPSTISHPNIPVRRLDPAKLGSSPTNADKIATPSGHSSHLDSPANAVGTDREDAKARLKQRLAMRKAVKKLQNDKSASPADMTSPRAFTTSKVRDLLSRGSAEAKTRESSRASIRNDASKMNMPDDVPGTISLPLRSATKHASPPAHSKELLDAAMKTPRAGNARSAYPDSITGEEVSGAAVVSVPNMSSDTPNGGSLDRDPDRDSKLQREAALACALAEPDADESSSIIQLAREIQQAAEDELSFHGSLHSSMDPRGNYGF
ncbi:hypothetical protein IV203_011703 [Nitzschia inconspicua]|uniref:Uncharacterized protein n=1 Tax=Nitzschia inconspicua TaxID=303405 RepID=A0A9K3PJI3_9STRA|nr:hypothetical protein IV203_011703 [Nitzschia inconspicua]